MLPAQSLGLLGARRRQRSANSAGWIGLARASLVMAQQTLQSVELWSIEHGN